jgi:hypothetical protein
MPETTPKPSAGPVTGAQPGGSGTEKNRNLPPDAEPGVHHAERDSHPSSSDQERSGLGLAQNKGTEKVELTEEDAWDELGFSFPTWKKWSILTIIFLVHLCTISLP